MVFRVLNTSPLETARKLQTRNISAAPAAQAVRGPSNQRSVTLFERTGLAAAASLDEARLEESLHANAIGSRVRTLVSLLESSPSTELKTLLLSEPALGAALVGLRIEASVKPLSPSVAADMRVLASRMQLLTRQTMSVEIEPGGARVWNHSTVQAATNERLYVGDIGEAPTAPSMEDLKQGLMEQVRAHDEAMAPSARLVHSWLLDPTQIPTPVITAARVGRLTMLTRVTSEGSLQELRDTLTAWQKNVVQFGHQNVVFLLSDDSPLAFTERVRVLADELTIQGKVQFRVLGHPDKERLRTELKTQLEQSESAKELTASGLMKAGDISNMVDGLFGSVVDGQVKSGPTENRNMAMFTTRGARSFNLDDDIVPTLHRTDWKSEAGELSSASTDQLPVDLLQHLESASRRPFSPALSGEPDWDIESTTLRVPTASRASLEEFRRYSMRSPGEPRRLDGKLVQSRSTSTRSPQYSPPVSADHPQLLPWAAAIHDGDMLIGALGKRLGAEPVRPTSAVTQTRPASQSDFDGLTTGALISDIVMDYIKFAVDTQIKTETNPPTVLGRKLLEAFAKDCGEQSELLRSSHAKVTSWTRHASRVVDRVEQSQAHLSELLVRLEGREVAAYAQWAFGRKQSLYEAPKAFATAQQDIDEARSALALPDGPAKFAHAISSVKEGIASLEQQKANVLGSRLGRALTSDAERATLIEEMQVVSRKKIFDYFLSMALAKDILSFRSRAPAESIEWSP